MASAPPENASLAFHAWLAREELHLLSTQLPSLQTYLTSYGAQSPSGPLSAGAYGKRLLGESTAISQGWVAWGHDKAILPTYLPKVPMYVCRAFGLDGLSICFLPVSFFVNRLTDVEELPRAGTTGTRAGRTELSFILPHLASLFFRGGKGNADSSHASPRCWMTA